MAEAAVQKPAENSQRIRGPGMRVLVPYSKGVPLVEALRKADEGNFVIASNKRHDKALVESNEWIGMQKVYACWSGTLVGHEKPGARLGDAVVYVDSQTKQRYLFPTGDAKGSKDVILVAEHPDYSLVPDGKDLVVRATSVSVLQNFPSSNERYGLGWYGTDAVHGIPIGEQISSGRADARYLARMNDRYVGAVSRVCYELGGGRGNVFLHFSPSAPFGVAVEAPDASVPASNTAPIVRSVEQSPP